MSRQWGWTAACCRAACEGSNPRPSPAPPPPPTATQAAAATGGSGGGGGSTAHARGLATSGRGLGAHAQGDSPRPGGDQDGALVPPCQRQRGRARRPLPSCPGTATSEATTTTKVGAGSGRRRSCGGLRPPQTPPRPRGAVAAPRRGRARARGGQGRAGQRRPRPPRGGWARPRPPARVPLAAESAAPARWAELRRPGLGFADPPAPGSDRLPEAWEGPESRPACNRAGPSAGWGRLGVLGRLYSARGADTRPEHGGVVLKVELSVWGRAAFSVVFYPTARSFPAS